MFRKVLSTGTAMVNCTSENGKYERNWGSEVWNHRFVPQLDNNTFSSMSCTIDCTPELVFGRRSLVHFLQAYSVFINKKNQHEGSKPLKLEPSFTYLQKTIILHASFTQFFVHVEKIWKMIGIQIYLWVVICSRTII